MKKGLALVCVGWIAIALCGAQTVYNSTPDWVSTDIQKVSTGAALVDLDHDGWLDFVTANGNDMAKQKVAVYYNQGDGTYPGTADWHSSDSKYNGHLAVADVNGDGWMDVAVAHLGTSGTYNEPIARVYLNNAGTLSATADWNADISGNAFGVAFGDVNNDGRPDLAVATGWSYTPQHNYYNYVYYNVAGTLEATASWQSSDTGHLQGVLWVDADNDGWLDLVGAASRGVSRMYRNLGGTLEATASWQTTDSGNEDAIMATAADIDDDGDLDLFITDNTQLGGTGRFRQYAGSPGGFASTYSWSYYEGYGSAVALADVDGDMDLDLATGGWWENTRLFLNTGSALPATPDWNSGGTSVVEKICFGDIDKNSLRTVTYATPGDGSRKLFYLPHQPIQEYVAVCMDGFCLFPDQYTFSQEHGWVTVANAPNIELHVEYTVSTRLDMAITNWDDNVGNFVYYNQLVLKGDANCDGMLNGFDIDAFVLLLSDRPGYDAMYPDCDADTFCDMNDDGEINGFDIDGFVAALSG
ncbi:MAG: VCBS repeat-containing protein [Planctomycetes bacterium]|nr:VCBS repeat-containing protein [Planctomycetota bacterium]